MPTSNLSSPGEMMIQIPSIGLYSVVESDISLYYPWKIRYSVYPNQVGNLILVGHSFTLSNPFSPPFYYLDLVERGDDIHILWEGRRYEYIINSREIVPPDSTYYEKSGNHSILTLYTCYPKYIGNMRLVLIGNLVSVEEL